MVSRRSGRLRGVPAAAFLVTLAACSMFDADNRRTLGWLDRELTPASTAGKVALAPVALPVGVVAFVADAALVHPVTCLDDAWLDTVDLLWDAEDETPLRRVLMTPVSAIATPFVFVGDWLGRWTLPISPRREDQ